MFEFLRRDNKKEQLEEDENEIIIVGGNQEDAVLEVCKSAYLSEEGFKEIKLKSKTTLITLLESDIKTNTSKLEEKIFEKGLAMMDKEVVGIIDFGVGSVLLFSNNEGLYQVYSASVKSDCTWEIIK